MQKIVRMVLRTLPIGSGPKKSAGPRPSGVENMPIWAQLKAAIDDALIQKGEMREVQITPEMSETYGLPARKAIQKFVSRYVKTVGRPYQVRAYDKGFYISLQVRNPERKPKSGVRTA